MLDATETCCLLLPPSTLYTNLFKAALAEGLHFVLFQGCSYLSVWFGNSNLQLTALHRILDQQGCSKPSKPIQVDADANVVIPHDETLEQKFACRPMRPVSCGYNHRQPSSTIINHPNGRFSRVPERIVDPAVYPHEERHPGTRHWEVGSRSLGQNDLREGAHMDSKGSMHSGAPRFQECKGLLGTKSGHWLEDWFSPLSYTYQIEEHPRSVNLCREDPCTHQTPIPIS